MIDPVESGLYDRIWLLRVSSLPTKNCINTNLIDYKTVTGNIKKNLMNCERRTRSQFCHIIETGFYLSILSTL